MKNLKEFGQMLMLFSLTICVISIAFNTNPLVGGVSLVNLIIAYLSYLIGWIQE